MNIENIVVTGGSKGIGKAICLKMASEGKKVFAIARNQADLQQLALQGAGKIKIFPADVTQPPDLEHTFQTIEAEDGPIDVLINNVGVYQGIPFWEQDLETIGRIIDVNLKGTLYATRLVLPYMIARKQGRIINISSVSGTRGIPNEVAYGASKHGMIGMADALAQEVRPHGILITTICPGAVDTPLWRDGDSKYSGDLEQVMQPEELADLVDFLLRQPDRTIYKRIIAFPRIEWH